MRTTHTNAIGDDWKTYDMAQNKYVLDDSASYVVRPSSTPNELWEIHFTRFIDGTTGNGTIVFEKRFLGTSLAVNGPAAISISALSVAPNPAANNALISVDAKVASQDARPHRI